ncbi:MAG: hypothetical protein GF331_00230 [Chitinivibrionales bacterium]|nr:hypothetical protein [Chitinivibrionales bacterium]
MRFINRIAVLTIAVASLSPRLFAAITINPTETHQTVGLDTEQNGVTTCGG